MKRTDRLLLANKAWAHERRIMDPEFFARLSRQQRPKFLWIGCSDSRVPANQVTGTDPGEVFVHRNVANLVVQDDPNLLSVVQYGVDVLKVEHIIVCGHYGCGGVLASMGPRLTGPIERWLETIRQVGTKHASELEPLDETSRGDRLVELNVVRQVEVLSTLDTITQAAAEGRSPTLHGWVYRLTDGILNELIRRDPNRPEGSLSA